ncbi:hypothetical protein [Algoriphagus confluentis]|uniref:Uncharacterized protein n=1 Tax=Algoriphagus confluentis TaxID=1697556 RepID=A0ABQ6PRX4_9BACT|nr:hypothetical protein Aconfl_33290 [Algoriphagus confluentis]
MTLDFPDYPISKENTIQVRKAKGKGLVGTSRNLQFDKFYRGKLKEGWTISSDIIDKTPGGFFSKESMERSLYYNLGVKIDDISSKTSDRFQFTLEDSSQAWMGFCHQLYQGKSTNYDIFNKLDFSKGKFQRSDFKTTLISLKDTVSLPWNLELTYERETPKGIIQTFLSEGMAIESGQLSNGIETILISPLFVKGKQIDENQYADIIKIVGGYKFVLNDKTLGIVDLYNQSISLKDPLDKNNTLVAAAATALLLRNR